MNTAMYIYTVLLDTSYTYGHGTYISGIVYNPIPSTTTTVPVLKKEKSEWGAVKLNCNPFFIFLFYPYPQYGGVGFSLIYI